MYKILVIDDLAANRRTLSKILKDWDKSYHVSMAINGKQGLELIKSGNIDVVLCDIKMPGMDGIEVLERATKINPDLPFVMLTAHGDVNTAVECMKLGAYDFLSKPFDLNRILATIKNALENKDLTTENKTLKNKVKELTGIVSKKYSIVGESESIKRVKDIIDRVAGTTARVLITGGNGVGKELVAQQIYLKSKRKSAPFVEVNCAAIPAELIESELFGHVKGSFTSSVKDRVGRFEQAHNGTLFLDEIGDMSPATQSKVLRALEEKKIVKVGSQKEIAVDVRVIAATNKDLKKEIEVGKFREDLYHRLAVILIHVPSLKERRDDIGYLIDHFVSLLQKEDGLERKEFSDEAKNVLREYPWTGNVRELKNVVERLVILGDNPITEKDIELLAPKP